MAYTLVASRSDASASPAIRRVGYLLAFLAIPAFGVVALLLGKEAGWDLRNYHWYDPFALLSGKVGFDIAVAHHATYYNPVIDLPFYWLGSRFPGWVAGLWLGGIAGVAAALIGAIAYRTLVFEDKRIRLAIAALLAVLGMTGGGALGEIGKTSDDIAGALGALAALLVLVDQPIRAARASRSDLWGVLLPAGFLAGASAGLKLTTAPYVVGVAVAVLVLPGPLWRRLLRTGAFGIGVLAGIAAFGGYWFWRMYEFSGDPIFPYFTNIFPTDLVGPGDYRDPTFLPRNWTERLFYPFIFSRNSLKVAEWSFRDAHVAIAYVLVPLAALAALFGLGAWRRRLEPKAATLVLVASAVTYLLWLKMFGIYRYLVPIEMLCPVIIAVALAALPLSRGAWVGLSALLLVGAQAYASRGEDPRLGWSGHYVDVEVPPLPDPAHTMVLMTETQPMAYVIPAFPPEIPFFRIQGWLVGSKDHTWGLGAAMHRRVAEHQGPLYVLYWPKEHIGTVPALADYGLAMDETACQPVKSNLDAIDDSGMTPLLCPLTRIAQ